MINFCEGSRNRWRKKVVDFFPFKIFVFLFLFLQSATQREIEQNSVEHEHIPVLSPSDVIDKRSGAVGSLLFRPVDTSSLSSTHFGQLDARGGTSYVQSAHMRFRTAPVQVLDQAVHLCLG